MLPPPPPAFPFRALPAFALATMRAAIAGRGPEGRLRKEAVGERRVGTSCVMLAPLRDLWGHHVRERGGLDNTPAAQLASEWVAADVLKDLSEGSGSSTIGTTTCTVGLIRLFPGAAAFEALTAAVAAAAAAGRKRRRAGWAACEGDRAVAGSVGREGRSEPSSAAGVGGRGAGARHR